MISDAKQYGGIMDNVCSIQIVECIIFGKIVNVIVLIVTVNAIYKEYTLIYS